MADIDTSFYPKASQNSLIQNLGTAAQIRNLSEQNKLLQGQQTAQQVQIDQQRYNLAMEQYKGLGAMIGSLAQDPRIGTPEGPAIVQQYADNAVKQGFIQPEQAQTALSSMPSDPSQLPQWLQTMNVQVQDGATRFQQIYGTPGTISNGSQTLPVTSSPITGVRAIGAPIDQTLSPSERGQLVQTTDEQGRSVLVPKGNVLSQSGIDPMTAKPIQQSGNALLGAVERGGPLPPATPAQNVPGGFVASPPAGQVEAQSAQAQASTAAYSKDVEREGNFQQEMTPLTKAYDALSKLGPTGTGPGTEQINEIKSFLLSMGVPIQGDQIKNFDEARKYLTQYAASVGDTGTNDKLAAAFSGNANVGISNAAAVDVVKTTMALRRMQNAQARAFGATGASPSEYNRWKSEFNAQQDPVAYGVDLMSPQDRASYFQGLNDAGKQKFLGSLNTAVQLGLVSPPSAE